jgi:phage/plasmid-like protein (TIGR03299 family)
MDAWHSLGGDVPGAATAAEALKLGRLSGWNVRKTPMQCVVGTQVLQVPGRYAIVRDNPLADNQVDVLGDVGAGYNVIQMEDLGPLLDLVVEESGATFETAGELDGGRKAFVTLRLPGVAKVGGVDKVDNYIAVMNTYDSAASTCVMVTPVRVSGQSTMNLAFQQAEHVFRVHHRVGAHQLLAQQAHEAMEFTYSYLDSFQEVADRLLHTPLPQARFEQLIHGKFGAPKGAGANTVTRAQNKLDTMAELFSDGFAHAGIGGTAWAGLAALTEWSDYHTPVRAGEGSDLQARSFKALMDTTSNKSFKNQALKLMLAVA